MIFLWDGVRYDTDALIVYPTSDPALPFVYVTPDRLHVFVACMDRWRGFTVREAVADEINTLARRFHLDDLNEPPPSLTPPP